MKLSEENLKLLALIENAIDPETEEDFKCQWIDFLDHHFEGDLFRPKRKKLAQVDFEFRKININDAIDDYQVMFYYQMQAVLRQLMLETTVPSVRCDYGTGILSSVFGAEPFMMPYSMNTLPTTRPISVETMERQLEAGIPNLNNGFGRKVFEMGEIFREAFHAYPKIEKYVSVYHPDLQGPLDITELLLDCELFYLSYDDPELLKRLIGLVADTYIAFMEKWFTIIPMTPDYSNHWGGFYHRGVLCLRDDSAMNLSADAYEEFAKPFDAALLDHFGGGIIHFCGRGDHYIERMSRIPKLYGINMSQPELNDMETIYKNTVDKGIIIFAFNENYARKDVSRPGGFHHNMHI